MRNGPKRTIRIPLALSPQLSFLAGAIIGDGHLSKQKQQYKVLIEMTSKEVLEAIKNRLEYSFFLPIKITRKRPQTALRKEVWKIDFQSKVIWMFFKGIFGIPSGKKSGIVEVPEIVFSSGEECVRQFITGLFLTDGGVMQNAVIFCSLSENLMVGLQKLLDSFNITSKLFRFKNKRLNKYFFEMFIRNENIKRFREIFPGTQIKFNQRG